MARNYISNTSESVRLYESDFMERVTHVPPATPFVIFLPALGWMLWLAFAVRGLGAIEFGGAFLGGVLFWTFVEYAMHRFLFHIDPKSAAMKRMLYYVHIRHHDYPNDHSRLVVLPYVSVPLAVIFYFLFVLVAGANLAPAIMAGVLFGYLCYDWVHYAAHRYSFKSGPLLKLKQNHLRHHYQDDHGSFGVTSPLWDVVFRTRK